MKQRIAITVIATVVLDCNAGDPRMVAKKKIFLNIFKFILGGM